MGSHALPHGSKTGARRAARGQARAKLRALRTPAGRRDFLGRMRSAMAASIVYLMCVGLFRAPVEGLGFTATLGFYALCVVPLAVLVPAAYLARKLAMQLSLGLLPRPRWHYLLFALGYLAVAVGGAAAGNVEGQRSVIGGYVLWLAPVMVVVLAALEGGFLVRRLWSKQGGTRPRRWLILLAAFICLAVVVGWAVLARPDRAWVEHATDQVAVFGAVATVAMLGRGLCPGRARRLFWRYQPRWLDAAPEAIHRW
jgi:FtsH-binding integral membrane protein